MTPSAAHLNTYTKVTRRLVESVAVLLFVTVLCLQAVNIFLRYVPALSPWMWVEDLTKYALIWSFFLLWHLADRSGSHFSVDVLTSRLPPKGRKFLDCVGHAIAIFFAAAVIYSAVRFIPTGMQYPTNSFSWIPMGVIYFVIPVGLSLVLIERVLLLVARLRRTADESAAPPGLDVESSTDELSDSSGGVPT